MPGGGFRRYLPGRHQDAHGDRQVEPGALLPEVAGREVDDHAAERPLELRVFHRRPDPVPRILDRGAGEAGHRQRREPASDECLNRDRIAANAPGRGRISGRFNS